MIADFEFATRHGRVLSDGGIGDQVGWLPGFRRVVYFTRSGALVVQDIESLQRRVLSTASPYPPDQLGKIVAAPDGRMLFYGARQVESNIWMVRRVADGDAMTAPLGRLGCWSGPGRGGGARPQPPDWIYVVALGMI